MRNKKKCEQKKFELKKIKQKNDWKINDQSY